MGWFKQVIVPRVLDWTMSQPRLARLRQDALAGAQGEVLEIGFGTGLNLPYYPTHVRKLTAIDPNPGLIALAQKRIAAAPIAVETHVLSSERLPFADGSFDSVVSTWTLCSIGDVRQALREVRRVLKPGGRFFFLEHGLSPDPKVQRWQHRLTPLQKRLANGCHLNRPIQALIEEQGFTLHRIDRFYLEDAPKIAGYTYRGVALN